MDRVQSKRRPSGDTIHSSERLDHDACQKNEIYLNNVAISSIVSENKVLCHPSSVDTLTTSAGTEDHVSMGGFSARKCVTVVEHVEQG